MKKTRILSVAFLVVSQIISAPVRSVSSDHGVSGHGAAGVQIMPSTVQMPGMIQQPMNQVNMMQTQPIVVQQPVPAQQPMNKVNVMPIQPMMGMQQSGTVQQAVQPSVASDQMFLQNTMNKLLGDKLKIMREKIEKYKKVIQQNASVLEQKVKAFFA